MNKPATVIELNEKDVIGHLIYLAQHSATREEVGALRSEVAELAKHSATREEVGALRSEVAQLAKRSATHEEVAELRQEMNGRFNMQNIIMVGGFLSVIAAAFLKESFL